jgi:hypothetical protein
MVWLSDLPHSVNFRDRWNLRRELMSSFAKTTVLSLSLLAGAAFAAHAQSGSIAALPPGTAAAPPAATAPIGPSAAYPGPNPGTGFYGGTVQTQAPVTPSAQYVGPPPGAGTGAMPQHFEKSADWDNNTALHPYSSPGVGPRPN